MVGGGMNKAYKWILVVLLFAGCGPQAGPGGIAPTPACEGECGPEVVFEPTRTDDIMIPFPNDMLCRFDPTAATQCRVNLGTAKSTRIETSMMRHFNELDGFSTFAPIIVSFTGPIDPTTVNDETVLVVNVDPKSPDFGKKVPWTWDAGIIPR
jgi:hypothetical protein